MAVPERDLQEALEDALEAAYTVPETEEARQQFRVENLDQAGWAVRKYARIERRREELRQTAELEIARIQSWLRGEEEKLDREAGFFMNLLADYHRRILEADPKAKTIKLPHGTLQMRAQQPEFKRDDAKLLQFLKADAARVEFVRVKEEPNWSEFKKRLLVIHAENSGDGQAHVIDGVTGEIVPGVVAEIRPPQFSIKLYDGGEQ